MITISIRLRNDRNEWDHRAVGNRGMKLLGTSLIAFGAIQFALTFVFLGSALHELGGAQFLLGTVPPCRFDIAAIVLIFAGFSVRKGSRNAVIVGLVVCGHMVLLAVLAAMYLARKSPEIETWQGLGVMLLGTWALFNAILLARARPTPLKAPGAEAGPHDGRPVLQFGLRSLFVLTFVVALVLGLWKWYAHLNAPPPCATVEAIETKYARQLARLADVAAGITPSWTNDAVNLKLFAPDEILSAATGTVSGLSGKHSSMTVLKDCDRPHGTTEFTPLPDSPGIDRPVTFVIYERPDHGAWTPRVVYENQKIVQRAGKPERVFYRLEIDVEKLPQK